MNNDSQSTVAIIGAGPYGLSIAAHLQSAGTDFRIFGKPMHRWRREMPEGMFLKSEGCASSLSDPEGRWTLAQFCSDKGYAYADRGLPVSLEVFSEYAMSFQRTLVPDLEELMVTSVDQLHNKFQLRLADGSRLQVSRVVVATGLEHTAYIPPVFARLPPESLSHSSEHRNLSRFKGKDVTVIGAGQSALETAALLFEEGASVRVLVRKPAVAWNQPPKMDRSLYRRLFRPMSGLGEGVQLWLYSSAPEVFRHFPQSFRLRKVKTVLDAAGAWWLRNRIDGRVRISTGCFATSAEVRGGRAALRVGDTDGQVTDLITDHVIAATGYRFDVRNLPFLSADLKSRLRTEDMRPVLTRDFESTVPGMYFTGIASANSFGPAMRFIDGTAYTARSVSRHIAAHRGRHSSPAAFQVGSAAR